MARASASGGLRQLVRSSSRGAGLPSACGKSVANRGRFALENSGHLAQRRLEDVVQKEAGAFEW